MDLEFKNGSSIKTIAYPKSKRSSLSEYIALVDSVKAASSNSYEPKYYFTKKQADDFCELYGEEYRKIIEIIPDKVVNK